MTGDTDFVTQQERQDELRLLRRSSTRAAGGAMVMLVISILLSFLMVLLTFLFGQVQGSLSTYLIYNMTLYVLMMGLPVIFGTVLNRGQLRLYPRDRLSLSSAVPVVVGGLGLCIAANMVATHLMGFANSIGLFSVPNPLSQDGTLPILLLNLISTAVLPAVLEEMLFRGVILQNLRRFGDGAAVVCSAALFGLMHANLIQVPFAFLLGLFMGYIMVKTGNILLVMVIHFLNNAMSILLEYVTLYMDGYQSNVVMLSVFLILAAAGLLVIGVMAALRHPLTRPLGGVSRSFLSKKQRLGALWFNPLMVIVLVVGIGMTVLNTDVRAVSIGQDNVILLVGEETTLLRMDTAMSREETVFWQSEDASIASVDQQGNVTAHRAGNTRIWIFFHEEPQSYCNVAVLAEYPPGAFLPAEKRGG